MDLLKKYDVGPEAENLEFDVDIGTENLELDTESEGLKQRLKILSVILIILIFR